MFYAMTFIDDGYGHTLVNAIRKTPFKTEQAAIKAVIKQGQGFVKKLGQHQPVWSNVK